MLKVESEVILVTCSQCETPIVMTRQAEARLRESHQIFYCLWGHTEYFPGKSETEQLRGKLTLAQEQCNALVTQKAHLEAQIKQAQEGNCPLCGEKVSHLARHMSRKHQGGD